MKMAEENKENKNLDEEVIEESIDEVVNQCEEPERQRKALKIKNLQRLRQRLRSMLTNTRDSWQSFTISVREHQRKKPICMMTA